MIIIQYSRSSLCMADDVNSSIYSIQMPDNATLGDLIGVLLRGGNGNDWPIPQTSGIGWKIYSNSGGLADISADKKRIDYHVSENTRLAILKITWVYGERADEDPDFSVLESIFEE